MVTGWRRAFCTSIPKDRQSKVLKEKQQHCDNSSTNQSPKISSKFGFFSNPSTPRLQSQPVSSPSLRCRTTANTPTSSLPNSPKLQCNVSVTPTKNNINNNNSPRLFQLSNPSSPKSPSSFSLLKSSLRLSKVSQSHPFFPYSFRFHCFSADVRLFPHFFFLQSRCGICLQSVKAGQGTAIFTAECSHSFHFPCIASHVKKNQILVCPVCNTSWKELPLLSLHHTHNIIPPTGVNTNNNKTREPSKLREVKTKSLRVYDDDEPLMSPTSGARFNPIPESDENESEQGDDENGAVEFQGFFVNSASTPRCIAHNYMNIRNVEVRLLPEAAVVTVGRSYETYAVVLKIKAPPFPAAIGGGTASSLLNPASRAPIDLVTVLDVSASTNGARLQMMKRAMRLVISSLCSTDRLSIVAFSATSKRLLPLRRMTTNGRRSARRIVDAIAGVGQGMCVNDALKKAAKVLEDRREKNPVATIMLLSEGHDDLGSGPGNQKQRSSPVVSSTRFTHMDIPVHTIAFNDSAACGHAPSEDVFAKCVGSLLSVVLQDLRLQLGFATGSSPAQIAAVYSLTGRPAALGTGSVRLGDLYAEEERELLVEMKVPTSSFGAHHVLSVRSTHKDPTTQELVYSNAQTLLVPRPHAVRSSSPNIERLRNLHVATRAVAESRRLVEHNDLSSSHHLLTSARALLLQSSSASADEYIRGLEAELSDLHRRRQQQLLNQRQRVNGRELNRTNENPDPLTPISAWRAAERLAKLAIMRKSMNRVSDLHGFESARF